MQAGGGRAGGNILDLVAIMDGCSVREAALRLQDWSATLPARSPVPADDIPPAANAPLHLTLQHIDRHHPYLVGRGLTARTIRTFGLGPIAAVGSARSHIPIHNERGELVAYAGRAIDGQGPKYRFPTGFRKSLVLFNLHRALKTATRTVIVVEGFFDALTVHQAGYPTVVALMGSTLSRHQADLLTTHFDRVLLMLDGDEAGPEVPQGSRPPWRGASRSSRSCSTRVRNLIKWRQKRYGVSSPIFAGRHHSMELLVREACAEDATAIVAIMNPIITAGVYTAFDTPFTIEAEQAYIKGFPARGVFHVAVDPAEQRVLGFQSMEPFATYTHAFDHVGTLGTYVDLGCRRQGIATALFEATFEVARRKGYEKILTFVRADNPAALATYLKQGFAIVGTARRHTKINGAYVDETIIERFL